MKFLTIGNIARTDDELIGPSYFSSITASKMMHWDSYVITKLLSIDRYKKELEKEGVRLIPQKSWCDLTVEDDKIKTDPGKIIEIPKVKADVFHIAPFASEIESSIFKNIERDEETLVSLDVRGFTRMNVDGELKKVPWLKKEEFLKKVDIVRMSVSDLYYLTGKATINSAMQLLKFGPQIIILNKDDVSGYVFYGNMKHFRIPIYEIEIKNNVGVEDVFITAFTLRYWETKDLQGSIYFGYAAASIMMEKGQIVDKDKVKKRYRTLREIFLS